jgi:hypothetical protein
MTKNIALCGALSGILLAQPQTPTVDRPAFEVASVKLHVPQPGPLSTTRSAENGRINYINMTLKGCIRAAYGLQGYQISGGPDWLASERYDIMAKAAGRATEEQMMPMLQPFWRTDSGSPSGAKPEISRTTIWWWPRTDRKFTR